MKKLLLAAGVLLLFFSGTRFTVDGYKPVYVPVEEAKTILVTEPREVVTQGKIYIKDAFIYVGDVNLGVHVIDNTDPVNPKKVAFIQIYGNHDIAIKGDILYADNLEDLVAIDISDRDNPQVMHRIKNVYKLVNQRFPENMPYHTWFECVDPSKGYVVGWIPAELDSPGCWTAY
jgi:hypothetical protein